MEIRDSYKRIERYRNDAPLQRYQSIVQPLDPRVSAVEGLTLVSNAPVGGGTSGPMKIVLRWLENELVDHFNIWVAEYSGSIPSEPRLVLSTSHSPAEFVTSFAANGTAGAWVVPVTKSGLTLPVMLCSNVVFPVSAAM